MLQHQIYHSHSYSRPFLTWRGMQAWCLGRRASGLCRFFIRIRTRPKLRLTSLLRSRNPQAFFLKWLTHTKQQSRAPLCCLPIIKHDGSAHCRNPTNQPKDALAQLQQKHFEKVSVPHNQHQDAHAQSHKLFKRVDESHAEVRHMHDFSTQLGFADRSIMSCLQRQSSNGEISFNSLSISSSSSSLSSSSVSGSFHRVSGSKLRETCAKVVHGSPSICELFAGNQFLVHPSAAPAVVVTPPPPHSSNGGLGSGRSAMKDKKLELNPSMGLPSLKHKESDINDRIVFFK